MTVSSVRALRKKGVNLLAGRALTANMYPLTAAELGENFVPEGLWICFLRFPNLESKDCSFRKFEHTMSTTDMGMNCFSGEPHQTLRLISFSTEQGD